MDFNIGEKVEYLGSEYTVEKVWRIAETGIPYFLHISNTSGVPISVLPYEVTKLTETVTDPRAWLHEGYAFTQYQPVITGTTMTMSTNQKSKKIPDTDYEYWNIDISAPTPDSESPFTAPVLEVPPCDHKWVEYIGLMNRFEYCEKCDQKKKV